MSSFNDDSCGCSGGSFSHDTCGCGPSRPPRTKDILDLIAKYEECINLLQAHINNKVEDTNTHFTKDWVESVLEAYVTVATLNTRLQAYYKTTDIDGKVAAINEAIAATNTALDTVKQDIISNYVSKADLAEEDIVKSLGNAINNINESINDINESINDIIAQYTSLAEEVHSLLENAGAVLDFTKPSYTATMDSIPLVVRANDEIVYVLGLLSDTWETNPTVEPASDSRAKAATAYIKYKSEEGFDAVVNMSVTIKESIATGAISVTASKSDNLHNVKLLLIHGADQQGTARTWLAVRADGWVNEAIDFYSKLSFLVAGINFIPTDRLGYKYPSDACDVIAICNVANGFGTNSINLNTIGSDGEKTELKGTIAVDSITDRQDSNIINVVKDGDNKHVDVGDMSFKSFELRTRPYLVGADGEGHAPFLTSKDITIIDGVGNISFWHDYTERDDGVMVAVNFPDIYLACDGTQFDEHRYPELFARLGTNVTPIIDYAIIKARGAIDITDPAFVATGGSLAQVIATMHGTGVYTSLDDLPFDVAVGTKAIVIIDNMYYVYVRTDTGWEVYND